MGDLSAGARLGGYEIVGRLKSGGMGTLYVGKRVGPGGFERDVALKVVHPHLAEDSEFVRMFVREARLAARIQHPNVVHVEELGQEGDVWFQAMELVRGGSLADLLKAVGKVDRALDVSCVVAIACAIADGLHAAHELSDRDGRSLEVVHRDVSPSNVLLSTSGHVKLTDFGVAKARLGAHHSTTGSLRGKLAYMAPEQAYGRHLDRRADVYALGVVIWEMLTLRRLFFARDPLALLDRVRAPEVPPPSSLRAEISAELDEVVLWALAPEADDRAPSARELRQRLAALEGIRPVTPTELGGLVQEMLLPGAAPLSLGEQPRIIATEEPFLGRISRTLTAPIETLSTANIRPTFDSQPEFDTDGSGASVLSLLSHQETPRLSSSPPPEPGRAGWLAVGVATLALGTTFALALGLGGRDESAPAASDPAGGVATTDASAMVDTTIVDTTIVDTTIVDAGESRRDATPPTAPAEEIATGPGSTAPEQAAGAPHRPARRSGRRGPTRPEATENSVEQIPVEQSLVEGVPIFDDDDF